MFKIFFLNSVCNGFILVRCIAMKWPVDVFIDNKLFGIIYILSARFASDSKPVYSGESIGCFHKLRFYQAKGCAVTKE